MTISTPSPGRAARDIQLCRAIGLLALAGLLSLVVGCAISPPGGPEATSELAAEWLQVASFLPWVAAMVLAADAFRNDGQKRAHRLRAAAFIAAGSFALEAAAEFLVRADLEGPVPRGYRMALNASLLSSFLLAAAALSAARAFAPARRQEDRERGLSRTFRLVAVGYGFAMLSALFYARAYSNYPDHGIFTQGLKNQAFGALGVAVATAWAASAFRRSGRALGPGGSRDRERRLFHVACALALSYLIICLGEALLAAGTVEVGYSRVAESLRWVGFVSELATVVAIVFAATGFRRAARD